MLGFSDGSTSGRVLASSSGPRAHQERAETGVDDRSLWAAPAGQVRLAVALSPEWLWLETSGGALVPLIRNETFSGSQSLYRDAPVVFHAGLGISLRLR